MCEGITHTCTSPTTIQYRLSLVVATEKNMYAFPDANELLISLFICLKKTFIGFNHKKVAKYTYSKFNLITFIFFH